MILGRYDEKELRNEVFAVKCSKRGNDVYRSRVYSRFRGLCARADDLAFFNPKDRGEKRTRALWVTLTYDVKLCSFDAAWSNIGVEFNRFMAYVRKKVGKVSCCRAWQSFENGYPHIHCILLFESTWFHVFRDGKGQFCIHSKKLIAEGWHSHVDVKGMNSLAGSLSYLKKYLLKSIDVKKADSKALKTLALCWAFRKRAFSVSGRFHQLLSDLIRSLHNSNRQLVQVTLEGNVLQRFRFFVIGFVPADVIGLEDTIWFCKLSRERITSVESFFAAFHGKGG